MNDVKAAHPDAARLADYALGRMDPADMAEVERHIEACASCARAIREQPADTLVELLQARGQGRPASADPAASPPPVDLSIPSSFLMPGPLAPGDTPTAPGLAPCVADVETQAGPLPAVPAVPGLIDHPRYRVLSVLGAGGMGSVYLAEHRLMERQVALKVIRPDLLDNLALVERFRREVKAAARLAHPNIVAAYDAEQAGGLQMLVMEYVEGADLARVLADRGPLPAAEACHYARQAALGLQHAHERGMVHRDIKPQNLMLTPGGQIKILDFGLARFASEVAARGGLTTENMILGSADYIAPDQIADPHAADTRADIYSLGCTLYHLLAGAPPYPAGTLIQKLSAHAERPPRPLAEARPDLPPGLPAVVARMMAKDPADRYQDPAEVAAALAPFASGAIEAAPDPTPRADLGGAPPKRRRSRALSWLALPFLLLGLGVAYRVVTDRGELIIETDDPDVRVELKQGGRVVTILDPKSGQTLEVRSGIYEVGLEGGHEELALRPTTFTMTRGDREIVKVTRRPVPPRPAAPVAGAVAPTPAPASGGPVRLLEGHAGPVRAVAFSPDGRFGLSGSGYPGGDRTARLWDLDTGREVRTFVGHVQQVLCAAFSPDGRRIITGSWDGTARLWDVADGRQLRKYPTGHTTGSCAFAPDGLRVYFGIDPSLIIGYEVQGKEVIRLEGHAGSVDCLASSPDGRLLISGGRDGTVRLWDPALGRELRRLEGPSGAVSHVAFSADGRRCLAAADDVWIWDVATGKVVRSLDNGFAHAGAFTPDGRRVLTDGPDSALRLWDVASGRLLRRFEGHTETVWDVAISPDGRSALSGGGGSWAGGREEPGKDWALRLWDLPADPPAPRASLPGDGPEAFRVAFAPDGKRLAVGYLNGTVGLWDPASGRRILTMEGPHLIATGLAFAPDGATLAASFGDWARPKDGGAVMVWDTASGRMLPELKGHEEPVFAVAYAPDGRMLASTGRDGTVRLWDAAAGTLRATLSRNPRWVFGVAFAPDGKVLASASTDATVALWDAATGRELGVLTGHRDEVEAIAFRPDGQVLASGSRDGTIRLWDPATFREMATIPGRAGWVTTLAFAPDGRTLASAHDDRGKKVVKLWAIPSGHPLATLAANSHSVAFAPDGRTIATGRMDGTVDLWDVGQWLRESPRTTATGEAAPPSPEGSVPPARVVGPEMSPRAGGRPEGSHQASHIRVDAVRGLGNTAGRLEPARRESAPHSSPPDGCLAPQGKISRTRSVQLMPRPAPPGPGPTATQDMDGHAPALPFGHDGRPHPRFDRAGGRRRPRRPPRPRPRPAGPRRRPRRRPDP